MRILSNIFFCLPVVRQVDRFIPSEEQGFMEGDLPLLANLKRYFANHYKRSTGDVEIRGIAYRTIVYEPHDVDDFAYALVGQSGVPEQRPSLFEIATSFLYNFLADLRQIVSFGESFPPAHQTYLPLEFLPPKFELWDTTSGSTGKILEWSDFRKRARVVLIGEPGIGKTTCLRMLALEESKKAENDPDTRLPVYVQLRFLREDADCWSILKKTLLVDRVVEGDQGIETLVKSGRLLLLFDGLDELSPSLRDRLTASILSFARQQTSVGIVISTRHYGHNWIFPGFSHLEVKPFSRSQSEEWLRRRLTRRGVKLTTQAMVSLLGKQEVASLASNPLLLTMMAGLVERSGTVPTREADLMLRFVNTLLEDWDEARGLSRPVPSWFLKERTLETLCRTAFHLKLEKRSVFDKDEFLLWEAPWSDRERAEKTLDMIWSHTGLCRRIPSQTGKWHFSHSLLLYVLAAKYLVECTDDSLTSFLRSQEYEDLSCIWKYACEITPNASHLIRTLIDRKDLNRLLQAILLAQILVGDVSVEHKYIDEAYSLIASTMDNFANEIDILHEETSDRRWCIEAKSLLKHEQEELVHLKGFGQLVRVLVGGIQTKNRLLLANYLEERKGLLTCAVAPGVRMGGMVTVNLSESDRTLRIDTSLPESL